MRYNEYILTSHWNEGYSRLPKGEIRMKRVKRTWENVGTHLEMRMLHGEIIRIDLEDLTKVQGFCIQCSPPSVRTPAVMITLRRKGQPRLMKYLSRVILNAQPGEIVDHINHDRFDNRKNNLRICTPAENAQNRRTPNIAGRVTKYKGVARVTGSLRNPWQAQIQSRTRVLPGTKSKHLYLGSFPTQEEAAHAYDQAAIKYFGPFASLNFPQRE